MKLRLSASSVEAFTLCPYLFRFSYGDRITSEGERIDLAFGSAMHRGLAAWHRNRNEKAALAAFDAEPLPDAEGDHRTRAFGHVLLGRYIEHYGKVDPDIDRVDGVERTLERSLGRINGCEVLYSGTLDLIGAKDRKPIIVDHKTTGFLSARWWNQHHISAQFPGYVWLMGWEKGTVLVNAISTRPDDKTTFAREDVFVTADKVSEWSENTMMIARQVLACYTADEWPMHRCSCTRMFGKACDFYEACELAPDSRKRFLNHSGAFVARPPSPTERKFKTGIL